ncbi:MAG: ATP-grasp domain-containing protein [Gammaproteobacteria bacterium]
MAPPDSYRVAPFIHAARQLNIPIEIASNGEHSLVSVIASGLHIGFDDPAATVEAIVQAAARQPYTAIMAADDLAVEIAARAAQRLGLPHNPPEAVHFTRWKHKARRVLKDAGLPVPDHRVLALQDIQPQTLPTINYPCVIKPLNLSASRGVIRVNNNDELISAAATLQDIVADLYEDEARHHVLLEQYIDGPEIALEGFLRNGRLLPIAVFDKPDLLQGPYFEETYYVTPSRHSPELINQAINIVEQACHVYGLQTGPIHAELRLHNNEPWIIEIAARTIGGECARLLEYASGFSLESLVIQYALGRDPDITNFDRAAGVLMIPTPRAGILRRVEGTLRAQKIPGIDAVHIAIREGHELKTLPHGASYLGFMFASAESPQEVETALRHAHNELNIVVAPLWRIEGDPVSVR